MGLGVRQRCRDLIFLQYFQRHLVFDLTFLQILLLSFADERPFAVQNEGLVMTNYEEACRRLDGACAQAWEDEHSRRISTRVAEDFVLAHSKLKTKLTTLLRDTSPRNGEFRRILFVEYVPCSNSVDDVAHVLAIVRGEVGTT